MTAPENLGSQFYGKNDVDALFNGHPMTSAPFPAAGGRKDKHNYDQSLVEAAVRRPTHEMVDPRTVHATQPNVTRAGVQHYMDPKAGLYKDSHQAGNKDPVVYHREDGRSLLLSGTHRATAALLRGEQFKAVSVTGPWGPAR